MREITNKESCCGCEVCASACPERCITMCPDEEGFLYPLIDKDKCTQCGKCDRVCPFHKYEKPTNSFMIKACAVQHRDEAKLARCASGGAYTAFAQYIVESGGIAVGASYEAFDGEIRHTIIEDISEVVKHSSSKYVQSRMGVIYKRIESLLMNSDRKVLFSGTPCQIVALKNYLMCPYENLICVDIVCKGVSSPKVFKHYKELMQQKKGAKVIRCNFKEKTYGYHSSTMTLWFENKAIYSRSRLTDIMMWCFTSHICDRPSCSACVVKGVNRYSDLTIFDCWHYSELTGKADDDRGHTNVLIHSKKGKELLEACSYLLHEDEVDVEKSIQMDGNMVEGRVIPNNKRELFFEILNSKGLKSAVAECIPITAFNYIKESSKGILYRFNLLDWAKKLGR